ncbi:MAG: hypothetical protein DYG89_03655 [Caldilinea sp. CFX5]|nr:hypothetical protein [Caldilinea sp. CFX5]
MATLQIRLFGVGQLRDGAGKVVPVRSRKELAALAYLLVEGSQSHSREVLQNLFWPDLDMESGRNNLRVTLAHLQGIMPAGQNGAVNAEIVRLFHASRSEVQFNPASNAWVDVSEFQRLIDETQHHDHTSRSACPHCYQLLHTAVALYAAEFLSGFALADCPAFEEWLFLQRERQHLLALKAYQDLSAYAEQQGELETALTFVQQQIAIDPLREAAYRQQMYILARQGERSLALAAFERCRAVISDELGIDPEPETLLLHQQILSDQILPLPKPAPTVVPDQAEAPFVQSTPTSATLPSTVGAETRGARHNLPQQLTAFIGREPELAQLQERLQASDSRLISLVGPGGIGKTRLAIQVGGASQHLFPDGVFFVALAGVQSVEAIPATIMAAMNATLGAGGASPTQQLLQVLAPQKALLLIDNLEHLIDGVDLLLALLQAAPAVTLLVTTREQLNCQAEDIFLLSGLATPKASALAEASHYAAVRLFCERAYRLHKSFKLTADNCPPVVKICQLVEGMPLAIELATTWLGDFDCAALAAAIAKNMSILATTQRDLPLRHRSMQAVFDYSWQMLTAREQQLLSQLAFCQGPFSAHIAGQLAGASLVDLTGLRYKSLLRIVEAGYYDLHPLIRTFALARLAAASASQVATRLATLYMQQVAEQGLALDGATPQAALHAIERELDNVQQAWQWAMEQERTDLLAQGVTGLGSYYASSGRNSECAERFVPLARQLIEQEDSAGAMGKLLCVRLLDKACHSLIWLGKLADAQHWAQTMLGVAAGLGNQEYVARALVHWGKTVDEHAKPAAAVEKYEEALSLARQLRLSPLIGQILIEMSHPLRDLDRASAADAALTESLAIQRSLGNRLAEQRCLLYLSVGRREASDFQADRDYLMAAMALQPLTGSRHVETRLLDALGINYGLVGNYATAVEYHEASRRIAQEIRQPVQQCHTLRHLCTAQRKLGNLAQAEECGLAALHLALANNLPADMTLARLYLGYVWLATGDLTAAANVFQLAYDSWRAQQLTNLSQEALVGLATVDLRQGNPARAAERIEPFVPTLLHHVPVGVRESYEMHLACYDILAAVGDHRAGALVITAYNQLQANINKVMDNDLLRCFWEAPAHRRIRALWQQLPSADMECTPKLYHGTSTATVGGL